MVRDRANTRIYCEVGQKLCAAVYLAVLTAHRPLVVTRSSAGPLRRSPAHGGPLYVHNRIVFCSASGGLAIIFLTYLPHIAVRLQYSARVTIYSSEKPTTFDDLIAEAFAAPTPGWDFSWLNGRATEERPSWGYQRLMSERLASASAALDFQTGCGEVLAGAKVFPPTMAATEWYPPNLDLATELLHPRGVVVVATSDQPSLPFADEAFDLVTSRHPHDVGVWWPEIARVLKPGGVYFAQHNGPDTMLELIECFLGPQPGAGAERHPDAERQQATGAGLQIVDQRLERLRVEFFDIGAVVYWLRKVIWAVPDFTVDRYEERLRELHQTIQDNGSFVTRSVRILVEARKLG